MVENIVHDSVFRFSDLRVVVSGDFACFTRPEMKVERVSYPVMTPSAARGVLESIFWKPQLSWEVREIWVLNPVRWFSTLRREQKNKASPRVAMMWAMHPEALFPRQQYTLRHTLGLRNVSYLIQARMIISAGCELQQIAFRDQFRRRVSRGACFQRPYLGCREFAASFFPCSGKEQPIAWSEDLGLMLWHLRYVSGESGRSQPVFFPAIISEGIMHVPSLDDESARAA
jgi:CRISPR-associated protein Cas5d